MENNKEHDSAPPTRRRRTRQGTAQHSGARGTTVSPNRPNQRSDHRSAEVELQPIAPLFAYGLLLVGSAAAMFLAGFAAQGNLGVFLLVAGNVLIFCPPSAPADARWFLGGGLLVACASCALLPARWLALLPSWRHSLEAVSVIPMPTTITLAPHETLFWLALLTLTVVLGLFLLAQPVRSRGALYLVLGAAVICGAYAVVAIYFKSVGWRPPLAKEASLGFLPNHNHTGTLLITGAILSLGVLRSAYQSRQWIVLDLAPLGLGPCVGALLFFSASRGGILFLFVGVTLWLLGLRRNHFDRRLLLVYAVALAVTGALFLAIQSTARDRLLASAGLVHIASAGPTPTRPPAMGTMISAPATAPPEQTSEFRTEIWRDALGMIADSPLTGTGLGTFEYVFPQYRQRSLNPFVALHPESDWLLFIAEAGLPAFVCLAGLGLGLTRRLMEGSQHPYWPLRWACAAAAITAVMHGMVDVPAHRAALGWWILILIGMSMSLRHKDRTKDDAGAKTIEPGRWNWQRGVFIIGGIGSLALGGMLVAAQWFGGPALPPFVTQEAPFNIYAFQERKNFAAAEALAKRVIQVSPMFDQPYFQLGIALANQSDDRGTDAKVDEAFRAQRLLDPITPSVPMLQGNSWAGYDPVRQAAMYLDGIARQARIDHLAGRNFESTLENFGGIVAQLKDQPDTQRYLLGAVCPDRRFTRVWLANVTPELAQMEAAKLANDEAFINKPNGTDRNYLDTDWYAKNEPNRLNSPAPDGRELAVEGWPVRLRQMVNVGDFRRAVDELAHHFGISLDLPIKWAPGSGAMFDTDPSAAAIWTACRDGDTALAKHLMKTASNVAQDPAHPELLHLKASLAAHDADWRTAWLALECYVQRTRQTEWP